MFLEEEWSGRGIGPGEGSYDAGPEKDDGGDTFCIFSVFRIRRTVLDEKSPCVIGRYTCDVRVMRCDDCLLCILDLVELRESGKRGSYGQS
jgi:hypothetical protein